MTDYGGTYGSRSVKYGTLVRQFDATATAREMQDCADANRRKYRDPSMPEWERPRRVAEAAYCQSLAERKAQQESKS